MSGEIISNPEEFVKHLARIPEAGEIPSIEDATFIIEGKLGGKMLKEISKRFYIVSISLADGDITVIVPTEECFKVAKVCKKVGEGFHGTRKWFYSNIYPLMKSCMRVSCIKNRLPIPPKHGFIAKMLVKDLEFYSYKKKLPIRITTKTSNNFLIVKDTELEVREVTMNFSVDLEALYELFVDKDRVYIASGKLTAESKLGTHHHEFYTFLHYAIIDEIFVELQQPEPNWERIKNIVRQKLSVVWHDFTIASVDLNRYMTRVQLEKNLSKRAPESIAPKDFREFARRLTEALIVFPGITNKKMQAILAKRHMAFIDLRMSKYYWVFFVPFMPREVIHYNYCMALYYHYLKSLLKEKNIRGDIETCKILKLFELISIDD